MSNVYYIIIGNIVLVENYTEVTAGFSIVTPSGEWSHYKPQTTNIHKHVNTWVCVYVGASKMSVGASKIMLGPAKVTFRQSTMNERMNLYLF